MRSTSWLVLGVGLALVAGPACVALAADSRPRHVMSLSMCTDALLLELLPPERIASLTYYSRDPGNSHQWPQAAKVRINWGTVEEVLAEKPDLAKKIIDSVLAKRAAGTVAEA